MGFGDDRRVALPAAPGDVTEPRLIDLGAG
jgi:hypothetical protein